MDNRTMAGAFYTILVCTTMIAAQIHGKSDKTRVPDAQCQTAPCLASASRILKGMDLSVKPCNNFYDFVCGNYENVVAIPQEFARLSSIELARQQVQARLQQSLDDLDVLKAPNAFRRVARYYRQCLRDSWGCSDTRIDSLEKYIDERQSGWPLAFSEWNSSYYNRKSTFDTLFRFDLAPDKTNSKVWMPELQENNPPLDRHYLKEGFSNDVVKAYYQYMVDMVIAMGVNRSAVAKSVNETLSMEIELYQAVFTKHDDLDSHERYSKTTLEELRTKYTHLGFPKQIRNYAGSEIQLAVDLETLDRVDKWVAGKSKRLLANWTAWRIVADQAYLLGDYFSHRTIRFNKIVKIGRVKSAPKRCIAKTQRALGFALGALYQIEYINQLGIDHLIAMFNDMKQQFSKFVQKAAWLDGGTRKAASDKVSSLKSSLSICRDWIMLNELDNFYSGLKINYKSASSPIDRTSCGNFFTKSQYLPQFNFVQVAAELYTELFHDIDLPKYLNYGAAGTRIGREMAQSLGLKGRNYDMNGNLKPWSYTRSEEIYKNRTKCYVDQYSKYKVDKWRIPVNGVSTLNENLADNVGVKLAYHAYDDWAKSTDKPEPKLPGMDYTPKQMFWISMASSYCTKYRPGVLDADYYTNSRAPNKARVNGPVSNSQEFASDFGCHFDSMMNPWQKCELW